MSNKGGGEMSDNVTIMNLFVFSLKCFGSGFLIGTLLNVSVFLVLCVHILICFNQTISACSVMKLQIPIFSPIERAPVISRKCYVSSSLSSWILRICFWRLPFWEKDLLQTVVLKGFSPEWTLLCTINLFAAIEEYSHWSHLNGLMPCSFRMCNSYVQL